MSASALGNEIDKDVLPWLQLAEDLRVLHLDVELKMPQICVMGDQSSGKSSVLEALSGIPFPRGSGLVTRCPIRMVMKRDTKWSATVSTSKDPSTVFNVKDIPELNTTMDRLMRQLCGEGDNNFSTDSVVVDLNSPDACDLTVVDLPGIIRTVTAGQNIKAIEQVNRLIKTFLLDERTIILAVIPASQDIATVDILERAQGVDPSGQRTIGVLTKTDLIGPGSEDEVLSVVNNVRKPLKLGYVMVKNKSQKDIVDKISHARARDMEHAFFTTHPVFKSCNSKLYGVGNLSKKLTVLLVNRIKQELAPMKMTVEKSLSDIRTQLRLLPAPFAAASTPNDRQKLLVSTTQEYVRHLTDCIRGEYRDRLMVRHADLRMFTIAMKKFETFRHSIVESGPKFRDEEFITSLASQIDQLRGRELPGFMSSQAFYMCMAQYVDEWQDPMEQLILEICKTAKEVAAKLADVLLIQYPKLRQSLIEVIEKITSESLEVTTKKLNDIIIREKDPFTLNDFLLQWVNKLRFDRFSSAVDQCFDNAKSPANMWTGLKKEIEDGMREWYRETHAVSPAASARDMSAIMEAYWNLSMKRFVDNCCMTADSDILGQLPLQVQDSMYQFIKDDRKLQILFTEDPKLAKQKLELENKRDRLVQAASKLSSIATPIPLKTEKHSNGQSNETPKKSNTGESISSAVSSAISSITKSTNLGNNSSEPGHQTLSFSLEVGDYGIGLIIFTDNAMSNHIVVKGFRNLPHNLPNPAQAAGMKLGDRIIALDDITLTDPSQAATIIRAARGSLKITALRKT